MQKLINLLAVTSFLVSAGVVGTGVYVYKNQDALIDKLKEEGIKVVEGAIQDALPSLISTPQLPVDSSTDIIPAIPF
jgi:hypothetical protein